MAENISIIKNALKSFSSTGEYDRTHLLLAAGKLSSTNPGEAKLLQKLTEGDNFTAFDKDGNGKLSDKEIEDAAKFVGPADVLNEVDLTEALNRASRMARRRPPSYTPPIPTTPSTASSTPSTTSSSPSTSSVTTAPRTPSEIENYTREGYQKSANIIRAPGGIEKTIVLDTIKLDRNRNVKTFIGLDQKVHFIIFSESDFSKEDSLIKEYTLPVETLKNLSVADQGTYISLNTADYNVDHRYPPIPNTKVIDASSESSKSTLTNIIKNLFLNDSSLSALNNSSNIGFRQARGIDNLTHAKYEQPPVISQLEEYTINVPELQNLTISGGTDLKRSSIVWIRNKTKIAQLVSYTDTSSNVNRKGKKFYRLIMVDDPNNASRTSTTVTEYDIPQEELQKIAKRDAQNVNLDNPNEVTNWIFTHFKNDKNPIQAFINREEGFAQLGEIENLHEIKPTASGNNLQQALNNANNQTGCRWEKVAKVALDAPGFKDGVLPTLGDNHDAAPPDVDTLFARLNKKLELLPETAPDGGKDQAKELATIKLPNGEYKRIIIENSGIRIIVWKLGSGRNPQYCKVIFIPRSNLNTSGYSRFAELTPKFIENALRPNNAEKREHYNYLKELAKKYFGYDPAFSGPTPPNSEDIGITITNINRTITNRAGSP